MSNEILELFWSLVEEGKKRRSRGPHGDDIKRQAVAISVLPNDDLRALANDVARRTGLKGRSAVVVTAVKFMKGVLDILGRGKGD